MRIGIMGAGSIGGFVGGVLSGRPDTDVTIVGRQAVVERVHSDGLRWRDQQGPQLRTEPTGLVASVDPAELADCGVVLVCVKSDDTDAVGALLAGVLDPECTVVSLQNGLHNADALTRATQIPAVAGIVSFNVVTASEAGNTVYHRTMDGPVMLGVGEPVSSASRVAVEGLVSRLRAGGVAAASYTDLVPHQWTKLLVNLNNAVSALSGAPTVTMLSSTGYRRIIAALVDEAIGVVRAAGVRPARLRGVPIAWMPKILRLPTWAVRRILAAQMKFDPSARSSMWEDLERRRDTEIRYLNGEVVDLAARTGQLAPLNERIMAAVEAAAAAKSGSPGLSAEALADTIGLPRPGR